MQLPLIELEIAQQDDFRSQGENIDKDSLEIGDCAESQTGDKRGLQPELWLDTEMLRNM